MDKDKKILCLHTGAHELSGSVKTEDLKGCEYRGRIDTDSGKCIYVKFSEYGRVKNVMDEILPKPYLLLETAFVDTGDKNDCNKNSLIQYISTSARHGTLCLVMDGKSLGRRCDNSKESICKFINESFGCSYDSAELLPFWTRQRETKDEKPVIYDHDYYMKMQECIEKIDALYTEKAEKLRKENMKAHPKSLWHQRHVDTLGIREKEKNVLEVEMHNASTDYPALCGKTRDELQKELMGTNVPAAVRFTVDTSNPDFMKKLPFSDEMRIKALKDRAVAATPHFNEIQNKEAKVITPKAQEKETGLSR